MRGHHHLSERLKLPVWPRTPREATTILDRHLVDVIEGRIRPHIRSVLRYPQTEVLLDLPEGTNLWFPIPGMYGGFSIEMRRGYLDVESWSRIVGGSGQAHVVTVEGPTLVAEGFA